MATNIRHRNAECTVDIETVPTTDKQYIEEITASITPPKSMSKPETIAKWELEEKPMLVEEAVAKTALDGTFGRICSIAWAFDDKEATGICSRDEVELLEMFFTACSEHFKEVGNGMGFHMVGHGISGFDLRFMWQRAVINRIEPSSLIPWNAKAWDESIKDTMVMWNPGSDKRIKLHTLCHILGVPSPKDKNGITGADIPRLWKESRNNKKVLQTILKYNIDDVVAERDCYRILAGRWA